MNKSIIIFGKGPSVLKCKKEIVDEYDDIAIINYPVLNPFFNSLIENRTIKYHFANCATYDTRYNDDINKQLNIKGIYNTHFNTQIYKYKNFLKNDIFKDSIREKGEVYLKNKGFNFNPSSGTLALQYILSTKLYNKICVVGFDNFKQNSTCYYYNFEKEANSKLKYLINENIISKDGKLIIKSGHCPEKTQEYYEHEINENKQIKYIFITNMKMKKFDNLITM